MSARDIGDGAIAGIITGIIIGVVMILLTIIGLGALASYIDINAVFASFGGRLPVIGGAAAGMVAMISFLLFTAFVGLILGVIFGALYENIPTTSAVTKGIVLLLVLWVIFGLLLPLVAGMGLRAGAGVTAVSIITSLIAAVIWGALLGLTFVWVARRTMAPGRAPVVRP